MRGHPGDMPRTLSPEWAPSGGGWEAWWGYATLGPCATWGTLWRSRALCHPGESYTILGTLCHPRTLC